MVVITYGTSDESDRPVAHRQSLTAVKMAAVLMAGLMGVAMVAAVSAAMQPTPNEYRSELVSYNKIMGRTTMLSEGGEPFQGADGEAEDQEDNGGYECCWHAPNAKLASTSVASKVGPNGWGEKKDEDGSVDHYTNVLGAVPDWVFKGTADHEWKDYQGVFDQKWYENTYPAGEGGI